MKEKSNQIYPSKVRVVPNCKLAKVTSNLKNADYNRLILGKKANIIEKKKSKNHDKIVSPFTITNAKGYDGTDPLTFFDYSVLSICIAEQLAGNTCTTPAVILRGLTGKVGKAAEGVKLYPEQRNAIMASIRKLMGTIVGYNNSTVNKELGYEGKKIIVKQILPAYFVTTTINGQIVEDVIYFYKDENGETIKSPIFEVADQRNQIIRYDTELLDVPNQNNTPLVIAIKNYVMLRVMEIKKHKITPTLTLDDIFKKARISEDRKAKEHSRKYIEDFFSHLQKKGVINAFEWTKKKARFYAVKFTF